MSKKHPHHTEKKHPEQHDDLKGCNGCSNHLATLKKLGGKRTVMCNAVPVSKVNNLKETEPVEDWKNCKHRLGARKRRLRNLR